MKKLVVLAAVLSTVAFAAPKVVETTGEGYKGPMKVAVTIDGGKVVSFEVKESVDTKGILKKAVDGLNVSLKDKTSVDKIDVIAGATYSSTGILEAVKKALAAK